MEDARRRSGASTSRELLARCPELRGRALPSAHSSREILASPRARAIFLELDLEPLPGGPGAPPAPASERPPAR